MFASSLAHDAALRIGVLITRRSAPKRPRGVLRRGPLSLRCSRCALVCPGDRADPFICWHCIDAAATVSDKVKQHGQPRAALVRLAIGETDDLMKTEVRSRVASDVLLDPSDSHSAADIVIEEYHSLGMTTNDHIERIGAAIRHRPAPGPAVVMVLSCWTNSVGQTAALQELALLYPSTIFVTFRDPLLRKVDCFHTAYPYLLDTVVFTEATPLVFLSFLCMQRHDAVLFAASSSGKPMWCGPLRVVDAGRGLLPACPGCSQRYRGNGDRWKKGVRGVRRRACQLRGDECADLLVIVRCPTIPVAPLEALDVNHRA